MRQETRFKFNAYLSRVAELNGIDAGDVSKKFTVEPSVTQTLMNTMQESSDFLTRINIVPVSETPAHDLAPSRRGFFMAESSYPPQLTRISCER